MAGAYLKAPCPGCVYRHPVGCRGRCVDWTRFHGGRGARKIDHPGGSQIS